MFWNVENEGSELFVYKFKGFDIEQLDLCVYGGYWGILYKYL